MNSADFHGQLLRPAARSPYENSVDDRFFRLRKRKMRAKPRPFLSTKEGMVQDRPLSF
jgi:hypothetical protein